MEERQVKQLILHVKFTLCPKVRGNSVTEGITL
jgi:hypothetical protein